jgi:hypothetical protein
MRFKYHKIHHAEKRLTASSTPSEAAPDKADLLASHNTSPTANKTATLDESHRSSTTTKTVSYIPEIINVTAAAYPHIATVDTAPF